MGTNAKRIAWRCVAFACAAMAPLLARPAETAVEGAGTDSPSFGLNTAAWAMFESRIRGGDFGYVDHVRLQIDGRIVAKLDLQHDYRAIYPRASAPGQYNYTDTDWHPYLKGGSLHTLQSISKSVTGLVFAVALQRGDIRSLDVPIGSLLATDVRRRANAAIDLITVRHLLNMASGIAWNDGPDTDRMETRERDWTQFVLRRPQGAPPGTKFNYSDGDAALLAPLFKAQTGIDIVDYARDHLFRPLGIERFFWKRTPTGEADTEGGLYLDPDDLVRIGQLVLDSGVVNGTRLYPADYIDRIGMTARGLQPARAAYQDPQNSADYSNLWWLPRGQSDAYVIAGSGYGGQSLLIVPASRAVFVSMGWNVEQHEARSPLFPGYPEVLGLAVTLPAGTAP